MLVYQAQEMQRLAWVHVPLLTACSTSLIRAAPLPNGSTIYRIYAQAGTSSNWAAGSWKAQPAVLPATAPAARRSVNALCGSSATSSAAGKCLERCWTICAQNDHRCSLLFGLLTAVQLPGAILGALEAAPGGCAGLGTVLVILCGVTFQELPAYISAPWLALCALFLLGPDP